MKFRLPATALVLLVGTACASLHPPSREKAELRDSAPVVTSGPATHGAWPDAEWWKSYDDPTLTALVEAAIKGGPSIASADARIRAAQEEVRVAGAALGLNVDAEFSYTRQRLSDNGLFPPALLGFHWYDQSDLGVAVRYQFDWWGKQHAAMESAIDLARARGAEREAAALGLAAAVTEAYFSWQADAAQLALEQQSLALHEQNLHIAELRLAAELDSSDTVLEARRQLAAERELIEVTRGTQQLHLVQLAGLIGVTADALPPLTAKPLPRVDGTLPDDVGTNLLARRPDIRASRWRVESALRDTDSARARFYPDISLHALAGLSSVDLGNLLEKDSRAPQFGLAVDLPLFDAGLRRAQHRASEAALAGAVAAYDDAVVNAAREAGSAAVSLQQARLQRVQREQQLAAAHAQSDAAAARLHGELTHAGPELSARIAELSGQEQLIQVDLAAVLADVQLKQALAGEAAPPEATHE